MDLQIHVPFLSDDHLNFSQICEMLADRSLAEKLCDFISSPDERSYLDADILATALVKCGHDDLFKRAIEAKYDYRKTDHIKQSAVLPAHLGLFFLDQVVKGINVAENLSSANEQQKEASSVDPQSPIVTILQCYTYLMKNDPEFNKRALESASICERVLANKGKRDYFVDLKPLGILGYALAAFQNERYDEAQKRFTKFLRKYSKAVPLVRLAIAQTLLAQQKIVEAEYAFKKVLILDSTNVHALTAMASIRFNEDTQQSIQEARDYLRKAIETNPNYAPALLLQATFFFNSNAFRSKAEKVAKKALRQATTNNIKADAVFIIAQSAHMNGLVDKAQKLYEKVVQYNPNHPKANFYLGLFASQTDPKKAIEYITKVHQRLREIFEVNSVLGLSYAKLYQEADVHSNQNYLKLAIKFLKLARSQKAPNAIEKIKVLATMGWLRIKSLKFAKAETIFTEAVELFKGEENQSILAGFMPLDQLLMYQGIAKFQNKKFEEALEIFEKSKEEFLKTETEDKISPLLRYNMSLCKEEMNRFDEAKAEYIQLRNDFPNFPEPLLRIAAIAIRDTRPNIVCHEALESLETIVRQIDPNNVLSWLEMANVYARSRQFKEARENMKKAQDTAGDGDCFIYSTVAMGNYLLESAQNKTNERERNERIKEAKNNFIKALRHNHNCVAAANGLAICWLLNGYKEKARETLQQVTEYRPDQASSLENLGLSYKEDGKYAQASAHFENANKKFFDKTNVSLLAQSYEVLKADKQWEQCLSVAETLCQIRPEFDKYWYYLASSLHKVVMIQYSPRAIENKKLKSVNIQRSIFQLKKCKSLYKKLKLKSLNQAESESYSKKIEDVEKMIKKLSSLKAKAEIEEEKQKREAEAFLRENTES